VSGKLPEWEQHPQSFLEFYANDEMLLKCAAKQEKRITWLKNDKEFHEMPSYQERIHKGLVSGARVALRFTVS